MRNYKMNCVFFNWDLSASHHLSSQMFKPSLVPPGLRKDEGPFFSMIDGEVAKMGYLLGSKGLPRAGYNFHFY